MNEPAIAIRRSTLDDAAAIADVHVASWRTTCPGIVDQAYIDGLSAAERAIAWARRLSPGHESAPGIFVATTRDKSVVGFISGGVIREPIPGFDAEIYASYLSESVQRAGVGRRLLAQSPRPHGLANADGRGAEGSSTPWKAMRSSDNRAHRLDENHGVIRR